MGEEDNLEKSERERDRERANLESHNGLALSSTE